MKFLRLTSVFLCCALLSSFLILPVSAVDDDNYYSFPPVGGSESSTAGLYPVNPAEFDNNDSTTLTNIYKIIQYLYLSPASWQSNSVIGFLEKIFDRLPSNLDTNFSLQGGEGTNAILDGIRNWVIQTYNYLSSDNIAGNLGNIQRHTLAFADRVLDSNSLLGSINTAVSGINGYATETTLSSLLSFWQTGFSDYLHTNNGPFNKSWNYLFYNGSYNFPSAVDENGKPTAWYGDTWFSVIGNIYGTLFQDYITPNTGQWSLYHHISNLSETLASEDDKQLAENYKENRVQAEQDFLNGKSGKTSLGKDDFGSLSSVGGTFKDTISLNGQSSLSDLTSGLSDADTAGHGWFSQATKDSLDAVSGSGSSESTVSTFSDDGLYSVVVDPDPYHMQGFEDNYAWLWGDD